MEQQKLPNVTLGLVLGILSFLCCCIGGIPAIVMGIIAYVVLNNDEKKYRENPEIYSNYSTLKTAKIIAIVAIVLGVLNFAYTWYSISQMGGWDAYMEQFKAIIEQAQQNAN